MLPWRTTKGSERETGIAAKTRMKEKKGIEEGESMGIGGEELEITWRNL